MRLSATDGHEGDQVRWRATVRCLSEWLLRVVMLLAVALLFGSVFLLMTPYYTIGAYSLLVLCGLSFVLSFVFSHSGKWL